MIHTGIGTTPGHCLIMPAPGVIKDDLAVIGVAVTEHGMAFHLNHDYPAGIDFGLILGKGKSIGKSCPINVSGEIVRGGGRVIAITGILQVFGDAIHPIRILDAVIKGILGIKFGAVEKIIKCGGTIGVANAVLAGAHEIGQRVVGMGRDRHIITEPIVGVKPTVIIAAVIISHMPLAGDDIFDQGVAGRVTISCAGLRHATGHQIGIALATIAVAVIVAHHHPGAGGGAAIPPAIGRTVEINASLPVKADLTGQGRRWPAKRLRARRMATNLILVVMVPPGKNVFVQK